MVTGLLCVDLLILLTWQLYDPLQRRLEAFPLEDPLSSIDDMKIRPEVEHCESENNSIWLGKWMMKDVLNNITIKDFVLCHLKVSCTASRD